MTKFFPSELRMKVFSPTTWICCFDKIVGVTSINPTMVPLVQIIGDLSLERGLPMFLFDVMHSC
jgi:hypothetical protein